MSELANAVAAGISQPLPGYILSPPRLLEYGEAELEFENDYRANVRETSAHLPVEQQREIVKEAIELIQAGEFALRGKYFDRCCLNPKKLPLLVWLSLRVKHPQITREQIAELLTLENEPDVTRAVFELWGFDTSGASSGEQSKKKTKRRKTGGGTGVGSSATSKSSTK
jgi:hypothetical protein